MTYDQVTLKELAPDSYLTASYHSKMNVFIQTLGYGQDATQVRFLKEQLVWIQNFPFLRSVAVRRLKSIVYPTIYV